MKKLLTLITLILIFTVKIFAETSLYHSNKVVVKFKSEAEIYSQWNSNGRTGEIPVLKKMLREHNTTSYIDNRILRMANSRFNNNLSISTNGNPIAELYRIVEINYQSSIDPLLLSKKLSQLPYIEYAEPVYVRTGQDMPNDSLINELYYLEIINAFEAWELIDAEKKVMVAIVDTGVDMEHEDLINQIANNPGEIGIDDEGNDKRSNEIDDDENDFIDDWRGWDFGSNDNEPIPGNGHGTLVGGIVGAEINNEIGVAGVANNAILLPVKVAGDGSNDRSISHGYQGILYAAAIGAEVINCSWGGGGRSDAEQETINAAIELGSIIVAAAGNNARNMTFYPSSYKGVISVAATDENDKAAWFTNYDFTVDVSAPGTGILSTTPENEYNSGDGTSLSSPIVAGIVAMLRSKFPEYNSMQIAEHLKASSIPIDTLNTIRYNKKLGRGRVDAYNTLSAENLKSIIVTAHNLREEIPDGVLEENESVFISLVLLNVLNPINNLQIKPRLISLEHPMPQTFNHTLGFIETMEERTLDFEFEYKLPADVPFNHLTDIILEFYDAHELVSSFGISLFMNQSYRTISHNNITTTITSQGNLGYNDFPANNQGSGFKYKDSDNLLFEGALVVATSKDNVSNVARNERGSFKDNDFQISVPINLNYTPNEDILVANSYYESVEDSARAKIDVISNIYQSRTAEKEDFILAVYDIINNTGEYQDSVYAGLFFDWDLPPDPHDNYCEYDLENNYAYVKSTINDASPFVGMKLLSPNKLNFYAIDNDGSSDDNLGIYEGFGRYKKWEMMTNGMHRQKSNITDISALLSAGPMRMRQGDTMRVVFGIFAAATKEELNITSKKVQNNAPQLIDFDGGFESMPRQNAISLLYPNPNQTRELFIQFKSEKQGIANLSLYDATGKKVKHLIKDKEVEQAHYFEYLELGNISIGAYILSLEISGKLYTEKIMIVE